MNDYKIIVDMCFMSMKQKITSFVQNNYFCYYGKKFFKRMTNEKT